MLGGTEAVLIDLEGFDFGIEGGLGNAEPGGSSPKAGYPAFAFCQGSLDHIFFLSRQFFGEWLGPREGLRS